MLVRNCQRREHPLPAGAPIEGGETLPSGPSEACRHRRLPLRVGPTGVPHSRLCVKTLRLLDCTCPRKRPPEKFTTSLLTSRHPTDSPTRTGTRFPRSSHVRRPIGSPGPIGFF